MRGFIPVDRQTQYLLPPSVEDWLQVTDARLDDWRMAQHDEHLVA